VSRPPLVFSKTLIDGGEARRLEWLHRMTLPWDSNTWEIAARIAQDQHRKVAASMTQAAIFHAGGGTTVEPPLALRAVAEKAQLLLQAVIVPGERTDEGKLVEAVAIPWFDIVALLAKDPNFAFEIPPDKWEEIVAGAYRKAGFEEVTLTPRSGDHGRDVIAVKRALGAVRVIDQVKAFKPPRLVTANDVRALMGVLQTDGASKGFVTTTSDFAPRIQTDPLIKPLFGKQLQLINGTELIERLNEVAQRR